MKISSKILCLFFVLSFVQTVHATCDGNLQSFSMNDPIDQKPFKVSAKVYRPATKDTERIPVIFILPPIVGETQIDRRMANKFCANRMAVYILDVVKDLSVDEEVELFSAHDNTYIRALAGVRAVVTELKKDPELSGKFGIMGMSLGGMISTYVAGSDPVILASVIIVGGGNVPGILTFSDQSRIVEIREKRMAKFNISSLQAYENTFKNLVPNDPISVAPNIKPGSMYMFVALNDSTVPTQYQQELQDEVPEPLVHEMSTNHVNGIIKAGTVHAGKITSFFLRKLR